MTTGLRFCICMLAVLDLSCRWMQFSPYETDVPADKRGLTLRNLLELESRPPVSADSFCFAVLGDVQRDLDALHDAITAVNAQDEPDFVLVAGDLTQGSLLREYLWVAGELERLEKPCLTVIGNHDALANGTAIYREMFGPLDYVFSFGAVKFIVLNTNRWEFGDAVPDFDFLETELAGGADYRHRMVFSHSAPFSETFTDAGERKFSGLLGQAGVSLSMHGHAHSYYTRSPYGDGVEYLVVDDVGGRNFAMVYVMGDSIRIERTWF